MGQRHIQRCLGEARASLRGLPNGFRMHLPSPPTSCARPTQSPSHCQSCFRVEPPSFWLPSVNAREAQCGRNRTGTACNRIVRRKGALCSKHRHKTNLHCIRTTLKSRTCQQALLGCTNWNCSPNRRTYFYSSVCLLPH